MSICLGDICVAEVWETLPQAEVVGGCPLVAFATWIHV